MLTLSLKDVPDYLPPFDLSRLEDDIQETLVTAEINPSIFAKFYINDVLPAATRNNVGLEIYPRELLWLLLAARRTGRVTNSFVKKSLDNFARRHV